MDKIDKHENKLTICIRYAEVLAVVGDIFSRGQFSTAWVLVSMIFLNDSKPVSPAGSVPYRGKA